MEKLLTITERGELSVRMKQKAHFYDDLKLYNQHFPGSKLSTQLTKVNDFNIDSLHSRMLYELLSVVSGSDIEQNRNDLAPTTEEVTDTVTEEVTDTVTEEVTDTVTEEVTDTVTEEVTDTVTEEVTAAPAQKKTKGKSKKNSPA
jgi:predicted transcriptional regulator